MTVWIVMSTGTDYYDTPEVIAIFSTEEAARKQAEEWRSGEGAEFRCCPPGFRSPWKNDPDPTKSFLRKTVEITDYQVVV